MAKLPLTRIFNIPYFHPRRGTNEMEGGTNEYKRFLIEWHVENCSISKWGANDFLTLYYFYPFEVQTK